MAVGTGYSKVSSTGLVFAYDTSDTRNSYTGRPTTNISAGIGMNVYNNVPGNVSSTLTGTGTYYRGAEIIKQTLTALDGSGASYLSGGNNPGIGVYTGGGGGTGGRYTGHSIFFKPTFPVTSCPVYTHYSNIGGWQSTCNFEDMGDGWFRAYVLWYAGSTASDGKYWAINPLSTTTGQTITLYWAGPFKEDLNSTSISQFVNGTRSDSQSVVDLSGRSTMTVNNNPFTNPAINPQLSFDGADDYIALDPSIFPASQVTIEFIINNTASGNNTSIISGGAGVGQDLNIHLPWGDTNVYWDYGRPFNRIFKATTSAERLGTHHWLFTKNASTGIMEIYLDGNLWHTGSGQTATLPLMSTASIGRYNVGGGSAYFYSGTAPVAKIYNRVLSAGEIRDNYSHYKTRFNLP